MPTQKDEVITARAPRTPTATSLHDAGTDKAHSAGVCVCVCAMDLHCLPPTHPARRPRTTKCQPPQSFLGAALRPQSLQTTRPSPPTALHTAAHRHRPTQPSTPTDRSVSPKRNEIHMPQCGISVQLQARSPAAPTQALGRVGRARQPRGRAQSGKRAGSWPLPQGHAEPAQTAAPLTPVSGHPSSRCPSSEDTDQQK